MKGEESDRRAAIRAFDDALVDAVVAIRPELEASLERWFGDDWRRSVDQALGRRKSGRLHDPAALFEIVDRFGPIVLEGTIPKRLLSRIARVRTLRNFAAHNDPGVDAAEYGRAAGDVREIISSVLLRRVTRATPAALERIWAEAGTDEVVRAAIRRESAALAVRDAPGAEALMARVISAAHRLERDGFIGDVARPVLAAVVEGHPRRATRAKAATALARLACAEADHAAAEQRIGQAATFTRESGGKAAADADLLGVALDVCLGRGDVTRAVDTARAAVIHNAPPSLAATRARVLAAAATDRGSVERTSLWHQWPVLRAMSGTDTLSAVKRDATCLRRAKHEDGRRLAREVTTIVAVLASSEPV